MQPARTQGGGQGAILSRCSGWAGLATVVHTLPPPVVGPGPVVCSGMANPREARHHFWPSAKLCQDVGVRDEA